MEKRNKKIKERFIYKITSARFVATLVFSTSYCGLMFVALNAVCNGVLDKGYFMGLFTGFTATVGSIITFYFTKHNRENKK